MIALIIIFLIYNFLQILAIPFFIVYLFYRKFSGKNIFGSFKQRIGLVPSTHLRAHRNLGEVGKCFRLRSSVFDKTTPDGSSYDGQVVGQAPSTPTKSTENIWFHAVSVGEVLSIQHLISKIKEEKPDAKIYLTVGTLAGKEMAQKNISADFISFMPYDFLPCMLLAFWRIRPSKIFIIEAEIWPNLLILSSLFKIKKYLINARISNRSYGRYKFFKFIFTPLLNSFEKIYAQSQQDIGRFKTLNIGQDDLQNKLEVLGDIKAFNVYQKYTAMRAHGPIDTLNPVLFVGSIHPGELDIYIRLYQELKQTRSGLKMILAPRHFHWIDELETKIKNAKLTYFIWTDKNDIDQGVPAPLGDAITEIFKSRDLLLVCKLGEMFNLYQFANIFYLGGTFVNIGGHNLLEPAVWSKACIIGPYHQNTQAIADQMEKIGGLIKVETFEQLLQASQKLLADYSLQEQMGKCNFEWLKSQAAQIETAIQEIIKII
jgi:3-deoxy-D-manno-octulosonic-acid transferase